MEGKGRKPPRPARPKAQGRPAGRAKKTLTLSDLTIKKLGVHASMTGRNESDVADELLLAGLNRFVVQDRGKGEQAGEVPPIAGTIGEAKAV